MLSPEEILTVARELEPRLPTLLGDEAADAQHRISPLIEQLAAGRSDGTDLLKVLLEYPVLDQIIRERLNLQIIEFSQTDRSFHNLPGTPSSAIPGQRYICPVPDCPEDWFRRGNQSVRICEEHGVVMVLATD